jgi:hypothetical protein
LFVASVDFPINVLLSINSHAAGVMSLTMLAASDLAFQLHDLVFPWALKMIMCDFNFGFHAALCKHAETCELEAEAFFIDPALLPTLEGLLLELYEILRPKPADYEQRRTMIDVFNKIAKDIFGTRCFCLLNLLSF